MEITKYGHCCVLIETKGKRILTDPGAFSRGHQDLTNIDLVLITHEHGDHLHVESLRYILANNPDAQVVSNESVGQLLADADIPHTCVAHEETREIGDLTLKAYDGTHVEIFEDYGLVQNTGFLLDTRLFYPGDAYTIPKEAVDLLALPVAGPWCKVADAIRYAIELEPKRSLPVQDATLS